MLKTLSSKQAQKDRNVENIVDVQVKLKTVDSNLRKRKKGEKPFEKAEKVEVTREISQNELEATTGERISVG